MRPRRSLALVLLAVVSGAPVACANGDPTSAIIAQGKTDAAPSLTATAPTPSSTPTSTTPDAGTLPDTSAPDTAGSGSGTDEDAGFSDDAAFSDDVGSFDSSFDFDSADPSYDAGAGNACDPNSGKYLIEYLAASTVTECAASGACPSANECCYLQLACLPK